MNTLPLRKRLRHTLRLGTRTLVWIIIGLASLLAITFAAINSPPVKDALRRKINSSLASSFVGAISLDRIGYIGLTSIGGVDVHALDATRRRVLEAQGIAVTSNWLYMVRDLLLGRPLTITLDEVTCDHVVATLLDDGNGSPSLGEVITPRDPEPESKTDSTTTIRLPRIRLRHLWARGGFGSLDTIDSELFDLAAAVEVRPTETSVHLKHLRLEARAMPAKVDPVGAITGALTIPSTNGAAPVARLDFEGTILTSPTLLSLTLDARRRVEGSLYVDAIPPERLRALAPNLALSEPTRLEAHLVGDLSTLQLQSSVRNDAVDLDLHATAALDEPRWAILEGHASSSSLGALVEGAPSAPLTTTLRLDVAASDSGSIAGTYRLEVDRTQVAGEPTPPILVAGSIERDHLGNFALLGDLIAREPGAELQFDYGVRSNAAGESLARGNLRLSMIDPPRLERMLGLRLSGSLAGEFEFAPNEERIESRANVVLRRIVGKSVRVGGVRFDARALGNLPSPQLDLIATAEHVEFGKREIERLDARASGTSEKLVVAMTLDEKSKGTTKASSVVSFTPQLTLSDISVTMSGPRRGIDIHVNRVALGSGRVQVQELELAGAGAMNADASFDGSRIDARFSTRELQIAELTRAFQIDSALKNATLSSEGSFSGTIRNLRGSLKASAHSIEVDRIRDGTLEVDASIERDVVSAGVEAKLGPSRVMAHLEDIRLPVAPYNLTSIQDVRGALTVVGNVDLGHMAPTLRALGVPIERAQGQVLLSMALENRRGQAAGPRLDMQLSTDRLLLIEQRPSRDDVDSVPIALETQPRSLQGIDLEVDLSLDAAARNSSLQARLYDDKGSLVSVEARAQIPQLSSIGSLESLRGIPFALEVTTPRRDLNQLPTLLRPQAWKGTVSSRFVLTGTLDDPNLVGSAEVIGLSTRKERRGIDAQLTLGYARDGGVVTMQSRSARRMIGALATSWKGDLLEAIAAGSGADSFVLDANVHLAGFPIGIVPALADRSVRGALDADLKLRNFGKNAELEAVIDARRLRIGDVRLDEFDVNVRTDAQRLTAVAEAKKRDGRLRAEASTPIAWGDRITPKIDPHARVTVTATSYPIATIAPLLYGHVSELAGSLDANLDVELTDGAPRMKGRAALKGGVANVPQVGQRFSDIEARVAISDGDIRLESLEARGTAGKVRVEARARLHGSELESVEGRVDIAEKDKLPITYEGVEIGDAWGHLDLGYRRADGAQEIRIDVPRLHVELPNAPMNDVQDLSSDEHIRIGVYRADGTFAAVPTQPLTSGETEDTGEVTETRVRIRLGEGVWIERPGQARVQLSGNLLMTSARQTRLDGQIELRGGKLDVRGKSFEIERGTVAFAGTDTSNPVINATARWSSPAGYAVYAEYSGTVEEGKLRLHAEPQLTQNEIISLLLFGSPEGSLGANNSGGGAAAAAVGVAGDTAVKGFNRVMSDFTNLDVSARIDTSTGSARPELVVQVSPRVTTRVTRALGQPAPGQSPDRTFLTLELRLRRSWALSGVVGDRGASWLDLLWRKRY